MSNIDKQAAQLASSGKWIKESGDGWEAICSSDDQANSGFIIAHFEGPDAKENREFIQAANPAAVLALLDELEAKDVLNKHLELAMRRAEGCSEALRRKVEVAEERIAELGELLKKSDVEKKQPQNTLSGRPVYLGDGSDAKEKVIAGKRDIHRYESFITDRAGKGD
ncbi:ead/Ea22-like family protein [Enterobacter hormaechei subsp. xiangfangensis]|uniref:ead/Ea22-like family protein n=1 Tax=Enterobacter hormaechei TaxID=158836 RepID=UPI003754785B